MVSRWFQMLVMGLATALAAGCATVREVDSQVQSWSTLSALPAPPTYRLERLPSQQSTEKAFAPIEALIAARISVTMASCWVCAPARPCPTGRTTRRCGAGAPVGAGATPCAPG